MEYHKKEPPRPSKARIKFIKKHATIASPVEKELTELVKKLIEVRKYKKYKDMPLRDFLDLEIVTKHGFHESVLLAKFQELLAPNHKSASAKLVRHNKTPGIPSP